MRKKILVLLLHFIAIPLLVKPQADNCTTPATTLTTYPDNCTSTSGNTYSATASGGAPACVGTPDNDVWYQFTTGAGSEHAVVRVAPASSGYDPVFQVLSGVCGSQTSLACIDAGGADASESATIAGLTGSTTYYIRTYGYWSGSGSDGSFTVCVWNDAAPSNDDCAGSISLTPGSTCSYTAGKSAWATSSGVAACTGNPDDDVWYQFTANATYERIVVDGDADYDPVVEVFSGGCGGLTSIKCENTVGTGGTEDFFVTGLTVSSTYYVRVYDFGNYFGQTTASGTFNICVMGGSPPPNDNCAGALALPSNGSCVVFGGSSTTTFATPSGTGTPCTGGSVDDDVWYSFVAMNSNHTITVDPNSAMNAQIQILEGACGSLLSFQCQDAGGINITENMIVTGLTIGNTYYVRISHNGTFYGSDGSFTICNVGSASSVGDDPCSALALPAPTAACIYGTYDLSSASLTTSPGTPGCSWGTISPRDKDIWFKVQMPANGILDIVGYLVAGGINDQVLAVYESNGPGDNCASLTYLECNDDYDFGAGLYESFASVSRPAGNWIYIRLGIRSTSTVGDYKTKLCVSTPENHQCSNPLFICDMNGFEGTTNASYGTTWGLRSAWEVSLQGWCCCTCGPYGNSGTSIENPSWLTFEASATTATITLTVSDCHNSNGIQFQIMEGGVCNGAVGGWSPKSTWPGGNVYPPGTSTITATGLTVGNLYYCLVDGFAGDLCNYKINGATGVGTTTLVTPASSTTSLCSGSTTTLSINPVGSGASTSWSSTPPGYSNCCGNTSVTVDPAVSPGVSNGTVTYFATVTGNCITPQTVSATVIVNATPPAPTISATPTELCGTTTLSLSASAANATNYQWFNVPAGGSVLGSNQTYGPQVANNQISSQTWYAQAYNNSGNPACTSSTRGSVTVPINVWDGKIKWTGTANTAWNNTSNWGGCMPDCNKGIIIPDAGTVPNSPTVGSYTATTKDLQMDANSSLTLSSSSLLNLCGSFSHGGALTISGGTPDITFNGSSKQIYLKPSTGTGELSDVIINNASGAQIGDGAGYQDMIINASSTLTLTNGLLSTKNDRTITVKNPATGAVSGYGTSSYITGRLKRYVNASGSYDFPVGNAIDYQLMNIDITSKAGLNDITVSFENPANYTGGGLPLAEGNGSYSTILDNGASGGNGGIWTVFPDAGTANYNITLWGRGYGTPGAESHTVTKRSTWCPGGWALDGTYGSSSVAGGVVTANRTGMSGFSQIAVAKNNNPLPVELLTYDLTCNDNVMQLTWSTASEINNDYFTIERSCDDQFSGYEVIATEQGAGNSSATLSYTFTDNEFPGGVCYYRLSQTDFDGLKENLSTVASYGCKGSSAFSFINIVPNPAKDDFLVFYSAGEDELVHLQLLDARGRKVLEQEVIPSFGINSIRVDCSAFERGVYFLKLSNKNKTFHEKVVKMN